MKGKYFFIENRKEIEIQEFDYKYVLNSLLKEYDRRVNRQYCYTVVVKRTYDSMGRPDFDVRTLPLEKIFFDNTGLNMLDLMKDEIHFKNTKIRDMPMPPLQREYMEWKEGKVKNRPDLAKAHVPAPVVYTKIDVSNDERQYEVSDWMNKNIASGTPLLVLDWIVNLPACTEEVGNKIQKLSEKQMNLNSVLQQHSDYIHSLMDNLTVALESLFPLKPSFMQKLFGGSTDIKVNADDLPKVQKILSEAIKYDTTKFNGLEPLFDELMENTKNIKEELTNGQTGCQYAIEKFEDTYEYELTLERLGKMDIVNNVTSGSLETIKRRYRIDVVSMVDIQTTTIPILLARLQNQVGGIVDSETVDIIRKLAYGKKED